MFLIFERFADVNISALEQVYAETINQIADDSFTRNSEADKLFLAEQRFAEDLQDYFKISHGKLFVLQVEGKFVSALRSEPYIDGELFSYLETAPEMRGRGYAGELIAEALKHLTQQGIYRVYSHINKKNLPSVAVHRANDFCICADYAKLLDGTVSRNYYTLQYNSTAE